MLKNVQHEHIKQILTQQSQKLTSIPANQPTKSGQLSGKYYRTRSLSQNLQQIFHPHRQSHSRSINNLSIIGGPVKIPTSSTLKVPQSLPQSPRILVDSATSPFFPTLQIPSLNFSPPAQVANQMQPMFHFNQPSMRVSESSKVKGFILGEYRKSKRGRGTSIDTPKLPKPLLKRLSWEETKSPYTRNERFQLNDAVKENKELLRKYSDPKLQIQIREPGSLQKAFKAKLASLFRNKKKYTIAEPSPVVKEGTENFNLHRCDSCQSLPTLFAKRNAKQKENKKDKEKKSSRKMKKMSMERCRSDLKLKSLNLNPPYMIGGSIDNLLLINRMNQTRTMMGTYDTYHGRPLISHASRMRTLYKYRKPSESDDATTLSFEYDSGDMSDNSSLEQSSSDIEQDSSSYSDLTTQSSSYAYRIRSSNSVHSMPHMRISNKMKKPIKKALSPNRSLEAPQFSFKPKINPSNVSAPPKSFPYHLTHQMSAPTLPIMMQQQQAFGGPFSRPIYYPSFSVPATLTPNPNQMIKAYFTNGPASSNEFPLVSFPHSKCKENLVK